MQLRASSFAAAVTRAGVLPGAVVAASAVEAQRTALLDCKSQRGIGVAAWLRQGRVASAPGQLVVQIVPDDRVSRANADAINACAARCLGLSPAGIDTVRSENRNIVCAQRSLAAVTGKTCGRSPSILHRGDLYCQWAER